MHQYIASFALTIRPRGGWRPVHKSRLEFWLTKHAEKWEIWREEAREGEEDTSHIHGAVQLKNKGTRADFCKDSLIRALGLSKDERKVALAGIKDLYDVEFLDEYASKGGELETQLEAPATQWLFADPSMKLVKNKNVQLHDILSVLWPEMSRYSEEERRVLSVNELQHMICVAAAQDKLKMPNPNALRQQAATLQLYLANGGSLVMNHRAAKTVRDCAIEMDEGAAPSV